MEGGRGTEFPRAKGDEYQWLLSAVTHRDEYHTWSIHSQCCQVYPYRRSDSGQAHEETCNDHVPRSDGVHPRIP